MLSALTISKVKKSNLNIKRKQSDNFFLHIYAKSIWTLIDALYLDVSPSPINKITCQTFICQSYTLVFNSMICAYYIKTFEKHFQRFAKVMSWLPAMICHYIHFRVIYSWLEFLSHRDSWLMYIWQTIYCSAAFPKVCVLFLFLLVRINLHNGALAVLL